MRIDYETYTKRRDDLRNLADDIDRIMSNPQLPMYIEACRHQARMDWGRCGLPWHFEETTKIQEYYKSLHIRIKTTFTVLASCNLHTKDEYYSLMTFARGCKNPFCDRECPLELSTSSDFRSYKDHDRVCIRLKRKYTCKSVKYILQAEAGIPQRVWISLIAKGIVRPYAESHPSFGYRAHCEVMS